MQAALSLPAQRQELTGHGNQSGFVSTNAARTRGTRVNQVTGAAPRGDGTGSSHTGLGEWVPPPWAGCSGVSRGSSPRPDPDPVGNGIGQNPGFGLARREVETPSLPHPQRNVRRGHSPGWSRLCSARICCAGRREKGRQRRTGRHRSTRGVPQPGQVSAPAAARGFRGQRRPQALADPTGAPRGERQCQEGDTGAPRAEGCLHPRVSAAPSPRAPCFPVRPPPRSGAACSTRTPGRAEQASNHSPRGRSRSVCATGNP